MTNKSDTERVNELKNKLEAHSARELLAEYSDDEDDGPESFEDLDDEVAVKLASNLQQKAPRQNAHIDDELRGAINGNVASSSRAEWEKRQNGDGS